TDGGRSRAMGLSSWGSTVPPYGAATAIRTMSTKSNPPPARVGLGCTKRRNPRWRRSSLRGNVLDGAVSMVYGPYLGVSSSGYVDQGTCRQHPPANSPAHRHPKRPG